MDILCSQDFLKKRSAKKIGLTIVLYHTLINDGLEKDADTLTGSAHASFG